MTYTNRYRLHISFAFLTAGAYLQQNTLLESMMAILDILFALVMVRKSEKEVMTKQMIIILSLEILMCLLTADVKLILLGVSVSFAQSLWVSHNNLVVQRNRKFMLVFAAVLMGISCLFHFIEGLQMVTVFFFPILCMDIVRNATFEFERGKELCSHIK